jgi:putative ABC transport system substrate-binding protein
LGALALLGGCDVASRVAPTTPKIARVARVGILGDSTNQQNYDAFREALRGLGWVEGQNITFERRYAEGDNAKLPSLATELLGLSVDVIATGHAPSARAAQQATRTIPIVIAGVAEPVSLGLAESLAYPGGNITGLARLPAQLAAKRLELLKEVLPGLARFAALWDLSPGAELQINATEAAAPGLGLEVQVLAVKSVDDFEAAVAAASSGRAEALTLHGPLFGTNAARSRRIADLAVRARLPSMAIERQYVEAGVLMSYGENLVESWRRAANYTDKILRGANPAELPIELSTAFELVINVTTAQALGLSIPPSVASRVSAWIR